MTGAELFIRTVRMKEEAIDREQPYGTSPILADEIEELAKAMGKHLVRDDDNLWIVVFDDNSVVKIFNPYQDDPDSPRRFEIPNATLRYVFCPFCGRETTALVPSGLALSETISVSPGCEHVSEEAFLSDLGILITFVAYGYEIDLPLIKEQ